MEKLTKRQNEVLDYIKKYIAKHGYPPAVREIGSALGLNSPATIQCHITALESKGYVKKTNSKYRSLEIVGTNEYLNENIVSVPILDSDCKINPLEFIKTPSEFFSLPSYLIPKKEEVFTLKVSGESMINEGIYDGDIVIVQKQSVAKNGDVVAVITNNNKVTLKIFYKEQNHIKLQSENDITFTTILGKVIGLYRKF